MKYILFLLLIPFSIFAQETTKTKTEVMTFKEIFFGDCFHLVFNDVDFGNGQNNFGQYDIETDLDNDKPKYLNKKFLVTWKVVKTTMNEMCNPNLPEIEVQSPTIISLKLID